jgi:hypothetical protein
MDLGRSDFKDFEGEIEKEKLVPTTYLGTTHTCVQGSML